MQNRQAEDIQTAIKVLETKIAQVKETYYYTAFGMQSDIVSGCEQLKTALESKLANNAFDLNITITISNAFLNGMTSDYTPKKITLLNFAAAYCDAAVVQCLLDNGAKPDNKTVHHAAKGANKDLDNVLKALESSKDFDINGLNGKGQTALYVAVRKRDHQDSVVALSNHHARMQFTESVKAPLENARDAVSDNVNNVLMTVFMIPKHHC